MKKIPQNIKIEYHNSFDYYGNDDFSSTEMDTKDLTNSQKKIIPNYNKISVRIQIGFMKDSRETFIDVLEKGLIASFYPTIKQLKKYFIWNKV